MFFFIFGIFNPIGTLRTTSKNKKADALASAFFSNLKNRTPCFESHAQQGFRQPAQHRLLCGTHKNPLTAASVRIWQGSWHYVAQDPSLNTTYRLHTLHSTTLSREFSLAIADCEYRAPLTPRLVRHDLLYLIRLLFATFSALFLKSLHFLPQLSF